MKIASTSSTPFVSQQAARKVELSSPMPQVKADSSPSGPLAPSAATAPQFASPRSAHGSATYSVPATKPIPTASDYRVSLPHFAAEHEARMAYGGPSHAKLPS